MQVDTNVDEADIGRVALEQEATFTVDSYPGQTFRGRVKQIRQAPQVIQNVVTYNTVVGVANPDLKLKPGMTANVKLLVSRRDNALLVPNAAFRVRLDGVSGGSGQRSTGAPNGAAGQSRATGGPGGGGTGRGSEARQADLSRQRLYVLADGKPVERQVKIGLSDGQRTEILEGVNEGDAIVLGLGQKNTPTTQGGPRLRL
jgi:HlyD family secretion protein